MKKTSIQFSEKDLKLIKWLSNHFGGVRQGAVVTLALKSLYDQQHK